VTDKEMAIGAAWREAANELGIEFTSPFTTVTPESRQHFIGLIHGFGRKTGTLIFLVNQPFQESYKFDSNQFAVSALTESYST